MQAAGDLDGRVVAVTAGRRAEDQAVMFRRLGARVVLAPTVATESLTSGGSLRDLTERVVARPPDYFVADTAVGVRSWLDAASGWGLGEGLLGALGSSRVVARGPKVLGALRLSGLPVWRKSPDEQLAGVAECLAGEDLAGRVVVVQLHGEEHQAITPLLTGSGAEVVEIPVYRWALPETLVAARQLVEASCNREVDAVTFTSGQAVRNLFAIAGDDGRVSDLAAALGGPVVAGCIGPVCAAAARDQGISTLTVPDHWRLGALVAAVANELRRRRAEN